MHGYICAGRNRNTDVSLGQCRSVVYAVAYHRIYFASLFDLASPTTRALYEGSTYAMESVIST